MSNRKNLNENEIIRLYLAGNSARKIASSMGVSFTPIYKILRDKNIRIKEKKEYHPKTGGNESKIIAGYLAGQSTTKLAKEFKVNITTINNLLSKNGVQIRPVGNYRTKTVGLDKNVVSLYQSGISMAVIGQSQGVSFAAIRDVLIRNNIVPRKNEGNNHPSWKGGVSKDIEHKRSWKKHNRKTRTETDPLFKLENTLRSRVGGFFRTNRKNDKLKARKNNTTFALIGASKETVFAHLESKFRDGMTWQNHGKVWHIDHIKSLASATTEAELIERFHYTNLQPLLALENMRKGCR